MCSTVRDWCNFHFWAWPRPNQSGELLTSFKYVGCPESHDQPTLQHSGLKHFHHELIFVKVVGVRGPSQVQSGSRIVCVKNGKDQKMCLEASTLSFQRVALFQ